MNRIVTSVSRSSVLLRRSVQFINPVGLATPIFNTPSIFKRNFAAADKKKGKKQQAAPAEETVKSDSLIPINIFVGMHHLSVFDV